MPWLVKKNKTKKNTVVTLVFYEGLGVNQCSVAGSERQISDNTDGGAPLVAGF